MTIGRIALVAAAGLLALHPAGSAGQTVEELQRQIDELRALVESLRAAQQQKLPELAESPKQEEATARVASAAMSAEAQQEQDSAPRRKPWYERLALRGYTQLRNSEILSGDKTAPDGQSRLRSVHDRGIGDGNNFTFRRIRLAFSGDLNEHLSFYLQPEFAGSVSNQSNGERRDGFAQLRDAYVDLHLGADREWKIRFGQSKIPFGWENLQSSSKRLTLDRSDAISSGTVGERDIGIIAYYTPGAAAEIWDRLSRDGQKLFGNYGVAGFGIFNGQGINRTEKNDNLMQVGMLTWPFALDGLGDALAGQVLELGLSAYRNSFRPEVRSGGVSETDFKDKRIGFHAILYPQPFGMQAEWNWGRGPEFDPLAQEIATRSLNGGYVQTMYRVADFPMGEFMPYGRWQRYRGGWKAGTNAPRLETDELELGVEWQPWKALELTIAYAHMKRREADERRLGRAEGDLIRTQLQWNY